MGQITPDAFRNVLTFFLPFRKSPSGQCLGFYGLVARRRATTDRPGGGKYVGLKSRRDVNCFWFLSEHFLLLVRQENGDHFDTFSGPVATIAM
jgi:hypothetical protein